MSTSDDQSIFIGCSATFVFTKLNEAGAATAILAEDDIQFIVNGYPGDTEPPLIELTRLTTGITILTQSGATLGQCEAQIIPAHTEGVAPGRYTYRVLIENTGNVSPMIEPAALFLVPV